MHSLYREIHLKLRNKQKYFLQEILKFPKNQKSTNDLYTFMNANRIHNELMNTYYPLTGLSNTEKLQRTANRVGFNLPRSFDASTGEMTPDETTDAAAMDSNTSESTTSTNASGTPVHEDRPKGSKFANALGGIE